MFADAREVVVFGQTGAVVFVGFLDRQALGVVLHAVVAAYGVGAGLGAVQGVVGQGDGLATGVGLRKARRRTKRACVILEFQIPNTYPAILVLDLV